MSHGVVHQFPGATKEQYAAKTEAQLDDLRSKRANAIHRVGQFDPTKTPLS